MKRPNGALRTVIDVIQTIVAKWNEDRIIQQSAALSYYTFFSLAPLLIIIIAVAGLVLGRDAIQGDVLNQLQGIIGKDAAGTLETIIVSSSKPATGIPAVILGTIALLGGALGVFGQIQASLNQIWHVAAMPSAGFRKDLLAVLRQEAILFVMMLITGLLILLSLASSAILAGVTSFVDSQIGTTAAATTAGLWGLVNFVILLIITILLFAAIYKVLPQAKLTWRDVWTGAILTAILFSLGRLLIGLYLGRSGVTSAYGAAGSLVLILLWINYSAQIFLLGAEFTHIYSIRYGSLRVSREAVAADKPVEKPPTPIAVTNPQATPEGSK